MTAGDSCLVDSNIVLRIGRNKDREHGAIAHALRIFNLRKARICYTSQVLAEFWNVATRPLDLNGFGLSIAAVDDIARTLERDFELLPDGHEVHQRWRRLLVEHQVRGAMVHDARLAASMYVHGIDTLLTINVRDFRRFRGLRVMNPAEVE